MHTNPGPATMEEQRRRDDEERDRRRRADDDLASMNNAGRLGIGLDVTCGTLEPSISLGGGIGIGLDGHLTVGGIHF